MVAPKKTGGLLPHDAAHVSRQIHFHFPGFFSKKKKILGVSTIRDGGVCSNKV